MPCAFAFLDIISFWYIQNERPRTFVLVVICLTYFNSIPYWFVLRCTATHIHTWFFQTTFFVLTFLSQHHSSFASSLFLFLYPTIDYTDYGRIVFLYKEKTAKSSAFSLPDRTELLMPAHKKGGTRYRHLLLTAIPEIPEALFGSLRKFFRFHHRPRIPYILSFLRTSHRLFSSGIPLRFRALQ